MGQRDLTGPRAAVEAYLAALNAHDPDTAAACVAEDFVNEHTSTMGHSRRGRAEYRRALDEFLADFTELNYAAEQVIVDGARIAVPYRMSCRVQSAGGAPLEVRGVFVFAVDETGLISHRTDYWDSAEVRRQLG